MIPYNPLVALLSFLGISVLIYVIFRPVKGWYWLLKNNWQSTEKTVMEDILKQIYQCSYKFIEDQG